MGMYNQDNANVAVVREREEKSECQQVVELVGAIVAIAVGCYVGFLLYDYHSENALGTTSKNIQKVLAGTHDTDDSVTPVTADHDCERDGQPGCLNLLWRRTLIALVFIVVEALCVGGYWYTRDSNAFCYFGVRALIPFVMWNGARVASALTL